MSRAVLIHYFLLVISSVYHSDTRDISYSRTVRQKQSNTLHAARHDQSPAQKSTSGDWSLNTRNQSELLLLLSAFKTQNKTTITAVSFQNSNQTRRWGPFLVGFQPCKFIKI